MLYYIDICKAKNCRWEDSPKKIPEHYDYVVFSQNINTFYFLGGLSNNVLKHTGKFKMVLKVGLLENPEWSHTNPPPVGTSLSGPTQ